MLNRNLDSTKHAAKACNGTPQTPKHHSYSDISNGRPHFSRKGGAFDRFVDVMFLREGEETASRLLRLAA
uniref:Uncharacterized protein n=1 Tax=Ixodes ricinus TaxID=34613 RepID=A0A6B0U2M7_IXORI